jgi:hypothetical protein
VRRAGSGLSLALPALALAAALAGCGGGGDRETGGGAIGPEGDVRVEMAEVGGSGITGEVSLSPSDAGGTNIVVELTSSFGVVDQPVGIYRGTCGALEAEPTHEFGPLEEGFYAGSIEPSFEELTSGEFAISVRESPEAPDVEVSCGQIGAGRDNS